MSAFSLALAYFYFQQYLGLPPCSLCILDRIIIATLGVLFLLMLITRHALLKLCRLLAWLSLLAGFAVGGRHVWLERFAVKDEFSSCIPNSGGALGSIQGAIDFLSAAFIGTSDCSVIYWSLWGLSIADLTLILYICLALVILNITHTVRSKDIFS